MDAERYKALMVRTRPLTSQYSLGYRSGLSRHYHGENYGNPREHEGRLQKTDEYGRGYRDGFAGLDPSLPVGRPVLPPDAPRSGRHVRSIRLTDAHWEKLKMLGSEWLENAIEMANEPDPTCGSG